MTDDATYKLHALERQVFEVANSIAEDYPEIDRCDAIEHLWAIKSTYEGTLAANRDMYRLMAKVMTKFNIDLKDMLDLSDQVRKENDEWYREFRQAANRSTTTEKQDE